jgi:hypothetical protein
MSWTYRDYTGNDYLEEPWYDREIDLFKAIIDKLPASGDTMVTTEHTHSKLVAGDGDPDPAVLCDATGNLIVGTGIASADSLLHVYRGDSSGTADAGADELILENAGPAGLSILVGDGEIGKVFFADNDQSGYVSWDDAVIAVVPDSTVVSVKFAAATTYFNPDGVDINTIFYWSKVGVAKEALNIDGGTGDIVINKDEEDCDLTVMWNSGTAAFVHGGTGFTMFGAVATPDTLVHIYNGSAGVVAAATNAHLTVENNGNVFISMLSPATATSGIYFGDAADNDVGGITYNHLNDQMVFRIGGGTLATIDLTNGYIWNDVGADQDARWETDDDDYMMFLDGGNDKVCFSTATALAAKVTILQDDASGESCLSLDQNDESEGCIDFVASARGAIATVSTNSVQSVRVELNGTVYRLALFADA